jgi:tetratricopeptide (TPR) repeat protein
LYSDFGWLTYYALKQTAVGEVHKRKALLNQYLQLDLPKPSILHSLILVEAIKVEQNTPLQFRIRDFIRIWGLEHLREEDWEQYRTEEGNTLPSTVEKLIGVYTKELKTDGVESSEDFRQLVDKALVKYPKNQNMPYYKATVLISQGKVQDALTYYKTLILQTPSKFYLWNQTAELVEDIDTKIGLLCKALTCGADDEFLGGVRLKLASLLYLKGMRENAKHELERYRETYHNKGWNLKPEFWQIYNHISVVEKEVDNYMIYSEYAIKADEFIYSSLPTVVAVKVADTQCEDRNRPGRKNTIWILRTSSDTIRLRKPTKFQLSKHTPNGAIFDIKLQNGRIVWIKEHTGSLSVSWLKEISGDVLLRTDRNGKKYAIVSGSYVGENLLKGINDGQRIKFLSIKQQDGRWSAISIINS